MNLFDESHFEIDIPSTSPALQERLNQMAEDIIRKKDSDIGAFWNAASISMVRQNISFTTRRHHIKTSPTLFFEEQVLKIKEQIENIVSNQVNILMADYDTMFLCTEENIVAVIQCREATSTLSVNLRGHASLVNHIVTELRKIHGKAAVAVATRITMLDKASFLSPTKLQEHKLLEDHDALYPYFETSIEETWKAFQASSSNILLIFGQPGLGKSSYIRTLLEHRGWSSPGRVYFTDHIETVHNPAFVTRIREMPEKSVLIMEDIDTALYSREGGNLMMSGLLNVASGLAPADVKIIISTNLTSLSRVDSAILRPGRLFKSLEFRALTPDEAQQARQAAGLPPADFGSMEKVTLAQALNETERPGQLRAHLGFHGM